MASQTLLNYLGGTPAAAATSNPATYNANFSSLYPNLNATQGQASANTLSRLRGELSPETLNAIQDSAARFGITSGMPLGSGGNTITGNFGRKLVGQSVEGLQSQGLQDYLNTLKSYSGTLMPTTGEQIGAETQRYGIDTSARTSANALAQNASQFAQTFPESQRQFNITSGNQNNQYYAGLDQNYLNSYLSFLQ
jgi:hypothetical protein